MLVKIAIPFTLLAVATAQQVGNNTAEVHPALMTHKCSSAGCTPQNSSIVVDANWRWIHSVSGLTNCYSGNTWDKTLCPDPATCAANCALEGADYAKTYGITTTGDAVTLAFKTGSNVGTRVYLLADDSTYEVFKLENSEFTFDTDVSKLPCGLNGAMYFSQMDADGGMSRFSSNKAGAKYGTGYCDAQCPQDVKFINGEANIVNWTASASDPNSGTGNFGACCAELDIWEANSVSTAYTPHVCTVNNQTRCENPADCGTNDRYSGFCDKDGCDFNSYRMGNTPFFGPGSNHAVDTTTKFTVTTQFLGSPLTEIRRSYMQNGKMIANSMTNIAGMPEFNSISDEFCNAQKTAFGDQNQFEKLGGMAKMGAALEAGMVLSMSIWDDHSAGMYWLDSAYPKTKDATAAGVARGTCPGNTGEPAVVEAASAGVSVTFSNIRYGPLNSTLSAPNTMPA